MDLTALTGQEIGHDELLWIDTPPDLSGAARAQRAPGHVSEVSRPDFFANLEPREGEARSIIESNEPPRQPPMPASVVAGVMGMNFPVGFFDNTALFWIVVAAMIIIAAATLGLARRRGLLELTHGNRLRGGVHARLTTRLL